MIVNTPLVVPASLTGEQIAALSENTNRVMAYIILFLVVFTMSCGNVIKRATRDLNNMTVASWVLVCGAPCATILMYATGGST